jgi:RNA polymerase sigma-70 factor (ECF subfamily)
LTSDLEWYEERVLPLRDRMIRSVWRILRDPHDAEDAFQNALATVWQRRRRVQGHAKPEALILRICIDAAYDALRRRLRRNRHEETGLSPGEILDPTSSVADRLVESEELGELLQAIARLSRKQAGALLMRFVEELGYDDIARALGCSEANARTHVARARARLCKMLNHLSTYLERQGLA